MSPLRPRRDKEAIALKVVGFDAWIKCCANKPRRRVSSSQYSDCPPTRREGHLRRGIEPAGLQ